jgi:hypothetical protein
VCVGSLTGRVYKNYPMSFWEEFKFQQILKFIVVIDVHAHKRNLNQVRTCSSSRK